MAAAGRSDISSISGNKHTLSNKPPEHQIPGGLLF